MAADFGAFVPVLVREERDGIACWTDPLLARLGVRIAFSERAGGVSAPPYESLNLAAHVGDEPSAVDANRGLLLRSLGLDPARERLTMSEQVHASTILSVTDREAGQGSRASSGRCPVPATDALLTALVDTPLLMCFADCVPVIIVAPGPVVAVVHAGWRGALAGLPGAAAEAVAGEASCPAEKLTAYVGAHIGACCYEVSDEILSQFVNAFGTVARAESGALDLGRVVHTSLSRAGVPSCSIAHLGVCTARTTERFFSHRAEAGQTGRHGALACILSSAS